MPIGINDGVNEAVLALNFFPPPLLVYSWYSFMPSGTKVGRSLSFGEAINLADGVVAG